MRGSAASVAPVPANDDNENDRGEDDPLVYAGELPDAAD